MYKLKKGHKDSDWTLRQRQHLIPCWWQANNAKKIWHLDTDERNCFNLEDISPGTFTDMLLIVRERVLTKSDLLEWEHTEGVMVHLDSRGPKQCRILVEQHQFPPAISLLRMLGWGVGTRAPWPLWWGVEARAWGPLRDLLPGLKHQRDIWRSLWPRGDRWSLTWTSVIYQQDVLLHAFMSSPLKQI